MTEAAPENLNEARALKPNLMQARDRLGQSIIEIVAADVSIHGREVIERLREVNVVAYARLVSDLVQFQRLAAERAPRSIPTRCGGRRAKFECVISSRPWMSAQLTSTILSCRRSIASAG